jgi:predicted DCC family thiol-disulfide oxidoreductase YuxK
MLKMTPPALSPEHSRIVLYDGLCGMCDAVVQFLLRHDKKDAFRFAPQQGEFARQILARHAMDAAMIETICVIENCNSPAERVFIKSEATIHIAEGLGGIWSVALLAKLLPHSLRDAAYDFIARNRYRIFGKRTACRFPDANDADKFLL